MKNPVHRPLPTGHSSQPATAPFVAGILGLAMLSFCPYCSNMLSLWAEWRWLGTACIARHVHKEFKITITDVRSQELPRAGWWCSWRRWSVGEGPDRGTMSCWQLWRRQGILFPIANTIRWWADDDFLQMCQVITSERELRRKGMRMKGEEGKDYWKKEVILR